MKKVLAMMIVAAFVTTMVSCNKNNQSKEELIVGKWDVQTYHSWVHDFTLDTHQDVTCTPATDPNYVGYDAAEFYADGTTRWHMSDKYVHDGMFTEPYKYFEWRINGDSLFVSTDWTTDDVARYAIKELDNETLVIELYTNNEHPEYSHHHLEQTQCYTFKRAR